MLFCPVGKQHLKKASPDIVLFDYPPFQVKSTPASPHVGYFCKFCWISSLF